MSALLLLVVCVTGSPDEPAVGSKGSRKNKFEAPRPPMRPGSEARGGRIPRRIQPTSNEAGRDGSAAECRSYSFASPKDSTIHERASLDPVDLRARTPPEDAWSTVDFDPVAYFDPEERRIVAERARVHRQMSLLDIGLWLLWYALFLLTPWAAALRDASGRWASGMRSRWPFSTALAARIARAPSRIFGEDWAGAWLFAWTYFGLTALVGLPLAVTSEALQQVWSLSAYSASGWVLDYAKQTGGQLLVFSCLVMGLYGLVRRFPRRWWLVLGAPAALVLVAYGVLEPRLARVYHKVTPLSASQDERHRALAKRLEALAAAEGIRLSRIHVIRASRTTRTLNAYLSGLGNSRELVLYDTLLGEASDREVEVAVAHELGHEHHRNDVLTYGGAALSLVGLLGLIAVLLRWGGSRPRMRGPGDVATLPLLGFCLWMLFLWIQPAISWRQRGHEREADRRALVLTADPEAFIRLQVRLAVRNQSELRSPGWVRFMWGSHPSVEERIATALWYTRWLEALPFVPETWHGEVTWSEGEVKVK